MKSPVRAMLAAVFISLFVMVASAALAPGGAQAPSAVDAAAAPNLAGSFSARSDHASQATTYFATAYCQRGTTQSGVNTRAGIAAADPSVLPVGSVVHINSPIRKYNGVYTVLDTGSKVQGRHVDLFIRDCHEAQWFGRQPIDVKVIRKGWNPKSSAMR